MKAFTLEQKIELLADILDMDIDELSPEMEISDLEWDSLVSLSYIAMVEENFGKEVKGAQIKEFVTLQDALNLMEG